MANSSRYYAGHGFHGPGGNHLSGYNTNSSNVEGTSLHVRDHLLEPLAQGACRRALVFIDTCATRLRDASASRDVLLDLDPADVVDFLDRDWHLGIFLSCSPGERSYHSDALRHGIWPHHPLLTL